MMSKKGRKVQIEWKPNSQRIFWARYYDIIIINTYAPTMRVIKKGKRSFTSSNKVQTLQ